MFGTLLKALATLALLGAMQQPLLAATNDAVAARLEALFVADRVETGSKDVNSRIEEMRGYYASRSYKPVWVRDDGPKAKARALLQELEISAVHGLDPKFFNVAEIARLLGSSDAGDLARADMLLSGAVVEFGRQLRNGRVGPETRGAFNGVRPVELDPERYVEGAADAGNFRQYASGFLNADERYVRLISKLAEYARIDQSHLWPQIRPQGPADFAKIRDLLMLTGDLPPAFAQAKSFRDSGVVSAIRNFQTRNSLDDTGKPDAPTLAQMAVQPGERIRQIKVNLERRRWQNLPLAANHIYVNLADRSARIVLDGETAAHGAIENFDELREIPTAYGALKRVIGQGGEATVEVTPQYPSPRKPEPFRIRLKLPKGIELPPGMQVFLTYITAWVSSDGDLYFAEDTLGRDPAVAAALGLD